MKKILTLLMMVLLTATGYGATYSVIGTINGNWDVDTDMTPDTSDGLYKATFTGIAAGDYEFKVRVDHDWTVSYGANTDPKNSPNYKLTVSEDDATIVVTFNEATHEVNATVSGSGEVTPPHPTETTYSVIGTINGNWDVDTDMTKATDGNYYYATFTNLTAATYQLKVRSNHKWSTDGSTEWGGEPTGENPDGNYWVIVEGDGATVTIYFDPVTHAVTHKIEGGSVTPGPGGGNVYSVIGTINGDNWDIDYDMTKDESDGLYKYTFTNVAADSYAIKVRTNHAWSELGDTEWGVGADNYLFEVQTGNSTVVVTFNETTHEVNAIVTEGGGEAPEKVWSVIGDFFGDTWKTDYDMTKNEDGTYSVSIPNVAAGSYEYKVRLNHGWAVSYPNLPEVNEQLTVESDNATVTITFNPDTHEITAVVGDGGDNPGPGPQPIDDDTYSVIGSFFGDAWTIDYDMTRGSDGRYTVEIEDLPAGTYEFKVRTNHNWDDPCYGVEPTEDNPDGNLIATVEENGSSICVTFNPDTHEVTFSISSNTPIVDDIHAIHTEGGVSTVYYNLSGQRVNANTKGILIVNGKKVCNK